MIKITYRKKVIKGEKMDILPYYMNLTGEWDKGDSYDWITDRVAIGDYKSSYVEFDVVVNLNFPNNCVEYHSIGTAYDGSKTVYAVGIHDKEYESESLSNMMDQLLPILLHIFMEKPTSRFLFHCRAGISRSVSMATAFMAETTHSTLHEALEQIQRVRPIALPNIGFMVMLMERNAKNYRTSL
jgi:protein-tyrosine phosphatase